MGVKIFHRRCFGGVIMFEKKGNERYELIKAGFEKLKQDILKVLETDSNKDLNKFLDAIQRDISGLSSLIESVNSIWASNKPEFRALNDEKKAINVMIYNLSNNLQVRAKSAEENHKPFKVPGNRMKQIKSEWDTLKQILAKKISTASKVESVGEFFNEFFKTSDEQLDELANEIAEKSRRRLELADEVAKKLGVSVNEVKNWPLEKLEATLKAMSSNGNASKKAKKEEVSQGPSFE